MLKRQRQHTPPPSSFSSPLIPDPVVDLAENRNSKRRRTLPPVLDGTQRGWAKGVDHEDNDEEDYYDDDEEDVRYRNRSTGNTIDQTNSQEPSSEYQATNSILRDLHTLQQHRLLFAAPAPSPASYQARYHPTSHPSHLLSHPDLLASKNRPFVQIAGSINPAHLLLHQTEGTPSSGEAEIVAGRYENVNKQLGELFLNRRRTLDATNDQLATSKLFH